MNLVNVSKTKIAIFAVACAFVVPEALPALAQSGDASISEKPSILLAQAKKRKKKKKKRKKKSEEGTGQEGVPVEGEGATPTEGAAPATVHGEQESPGLYKWHVSLMSDFKIVSQETGDAKSDTDSVFLLVYIKTPETTA